MPINALYCEFIADFYLSVDFGNGEVGLTTRTGEAPVGELPPLEHESFNLEKGDALMIETEAFFKAIQEDTQCIVNGEAGLRALELAEQISELARQSAERAL